MAVILLMLLNAGCGTDESRQQQQDQSAPFLDFPEHGAYTGAYIDFGTTEDAISLEAIEDFEKLVGKRQAIIASSSFWGEQSFPARGVRIIDHYGATPLLYWSPWDKPYKENVGPDLFSLRNILSGMWDGYIDRWADEAKAFQKPVLVSWGLEMNGNWFPWSGSYYRTEGSPSSPEGSPETEGPEIFRQAFRYVVNRARARGATNILWGFHINTQSYPEEAWNAPENYYPGDDYVDWLGLSIYGKQVHEDPWVTFHELMGPAYERLCALNPNKPVLAAEWGVGEFPRSGSKPEWISEAFEAMKREYPRVKGAVYWHERWHNADGSHSNLRVNSSPEALHAYRQGVGDPHWTGRLQFLP